MKLLISIIILLSFQQQAFSLTRSELRDEIRIKINDEGPSSSEYLWTDTTLNRRINIIQQEVAVRADCVIRRDFIDTTTGTLTYVLPTSPRILKVLRVSYEDSGSTGTYKKLDYISIKKLDRDYSNWENTGSGTPLDWYRLFLSTWSTSEVRVGIFPPATGDDTGSNKLRVDYSHIPTSLTSDSDIPFNNNPRLFPFHTLIIKGVVAMTTGNTIDIALYEAGIERLILFLQDIAGIEGSIVPRIK